MVLATILVDTTCCARAGHVTGQQHVTRAFCRGLHCATTVCKYLEPGQCCEHLNTEGKGLEGFGSTFLRVKLCRLVCHIHRGYTAQVLPGVRRDAKELDRIELDTGRTWCLLSSG